MLPPDEPLLERKLAGRSCDPGAQAVVGRWQNGGLHPQRRGDPRRHRRERLPAPERLRPGEMEPQVAVAELEPRLRAELLGRGARVPGLVRATPALLGVEQARERVDDRVEVGRDVETRYLEVVADVADNGDAARAERLGQRQREARAAEAARQDRNSHRVKPARSSSNTALVWGPSRPSSRSRSPSVSTSSARFGMRAVADGTPRRSARPRNRSALPGP